MALIVITLQDGDPGPLAPPGTGGVQVNVQCEPGPLPDVDQVVGNESVTPATFAAVLMIDAARHAIAQLNAANAETN